MVDWMFAAPAAVGAIVGSAGTYFGNARIQSARPTMSILSCTLSPDLSRADEPARPNKELLLAFEKTPEIGADWLDRYEDISEVDYVTYLQDSMRELRLQKDRRPIFNGVVTALREALFKERYDDFRSLWADEHAILWTPLITAFSRGDLPDLPQRDIQLSRAQIRERDGYVILVDRDRFMYFSYDEDDDKQIPFCWRAAIAIAECVRDDCKTLLDHLEEYGKSSRLEDLLARVERELARFDRLQVTGHLSNTGRQPCSIPNSAKLFLKTAGAPRKTIDPDGKPMAADAYEGNVEIELLIVDDSGDEYDFDSPLEIGAGKLVPFVGASARALQDFDFGSDLIAKLSGGGLKAQVGYVVSKAGTNKLSTQYCKEFDFIASSTRIQIEAPRSLARRTLSRVLRTRQNST